MLRVSVDTKRADRYLKRIGSSIDGGMNAVLDRELRMLMATARFLAPRLTGATRRGIYLGETSKTKKIKRGTVKWKELDRRRAKSWARSNTRYDDFGTWLNESPTPLSYNYRNGYPRFFSMAVKSRRKAAIKGVQLEIEKSIKR